MAVSVAPEPEIRAARAYVAESSLKSHAPAEVSPVSGKRLQKKVDGKDGRMCNASVENIVLV